jgi:hypothetical protein
MRKSFLVVLSFFFVALGFSQEKYWKFEVEQSTPRVNSPRLVTPKFYRTVFLSFDQYKIYLQTAPKEFETSVKNGLQISLPYPDNSFKKFRIVETKMMEDPLAAEFPGIKTYLGQGIDEPTASVRIDYTYQGFHAFVISPNGNLFIDPYQKANTKLYLTYFSKDYQNPLKENFQCKLGDPLKLSTNSSLNEPLAGTCIGNELRTYKTAISCTHEYAEAVCPVGDVTLANTTSAIVTTLNRVNGVYQTELGIKLLLIGSNSAIVYVDSGSDPYTGNDDGPTLLNESQSNITSVIGSANFDVGHTFSTGGGGLADQGSVCNNSFKAKGVTGNPDPTGDAYDIDFVAHEMGHQFGGAHTFESETGNCGGGNRIKLSAYEPGSGTTVMAYAGICGSDNLQPNSNPYFHTKSFDEIVAYTTTGTGSTCPVITSTGNHIPVVLMPGSGTKIPKATPFTLTATATDEDNDALTYSWEEWDLSNDDNGSAWDAGANSTKKPLFKVRDPKTSGSRTFPDMDVILAGYPSNPPAVMNGLKGETLPQVARDIKFRFVARDNQATGGGVATGGNGCSSTSQFKVVVTDDGPFTVTAPNTAVNWLGGTTQTVSWDVGNTDDASGIDAQNVDILMSTDGGQTYTTVILAGTPNDGTQDIVVPNIATNTQVRFMVKASDNIFFDISDVDFTITFNSVLPVSLLQFFVKPGRSAIQLTWATTTEINNRGFEILRSEGSSNKFTRIGFVEGTVNTNTVQNYLFLDNNVRKGVDYFYRLRHIDVDNNSVYSTLKRGKIDIGGIFTVAVYPQPVHNMAELSVDGIEKTDFKIIISDVAGRILSTKQIKNNVENRSLTVNLSQEANGVYFIKVVQNKIQQTIRVAKL